MAKDTRIAFRASAELKRRLKAASKIVKLNETDLAQAAVVAAVEYIEQEGGIWLPLQVVPHPAADFGDAGEKRSAANAGGPSTSSTLAPRELPEPPGDPRLNESSPGYGAKKKKS